MNADNPTPRVGYSQLKDFIGKRVIFVGKVENLESGVVHLQAPDGSRVKVQANSTYDTAYVEVLGTVVDPETIREELHVHYGESFGEPFDNHHVTAPTQVVSHSCAAAVAACLAVGSTSACASVRAILHVLHRSATTPQLSSISNWPCCPAYAMQT